MKDKLKWLLATTFLVPSNAIFAVLSFTYYSCGYNNVESGKNKNCT